MHSAVRLAILPIATLALGGCVAAALPALAGGAMIGTGGSDETAPQNQQATPPIQDTSLTQAEAPQPAPVAERETAGAFASFVSYARDRAMSAESNSGVATAILANPGMLDGDRVECTGLPPAVLIDLDHGDEIFGLHDAYQSPRLLAAGLASLRDAGIELGWISGANMDHAGAIRYALAQSGLDPAGNDPLLLSQYTDDRKQVRRQQFAQSHCILAIAGDRLADFDELFLFLENSDAARPLDTLLGDGWFITPLALTKR